MVKGPADNGMPKPVISKPRVQDLVPQQRMFGEPQSAREAPKNTAALEVENLPDKPV